MDSALQERVRQRAGGACEYCQMPQNLEYLPFQIDHIITATRIKARTSQALIQRVEKSCDCSIRAGTYRWSTSLEGAMLRARTPIGRATIHVLCINDTEYVAVRVSLIAEGAFPPKSRV